MKTLLASFGLLAAVLLIGCSERNPATTLDVGTEDEAGTNIDQAVTPPGDGPVTPPGDGPVTPPGDGPVTPPGDGPVTPPGDGPVIKPDAPPVKKCTSTAQCVPYSCNISSGNCRSSCTSSYHCATAFGYYCNASTNKCVKPPACTTVNDPKCNGYDCNVSTGLCRLSCSYSSHCQTGYTCSNNKCVKQVTCNTLNDPVCKGYKCNTSAGICRTYCQSSTQHCASGHICIPGNTCSKTTPCTSNAQCKNNLICNTVQGACYTYCNCSYSTSLCVSGFSCDPTRTKCVKPKACTSNSQCSGYDCLNQGSNPGVCRTCCSSPYHCNGGAQCNNGACS